VSDHAFTPRRGPILVEAEVTGPSKGANLRLVLDTGATMSLIDRLTLLQIGFDPGRSARRVRMTIGSTVELVPVVLTRLSALGQHRLGFPGISHALPGNSGVDGLLGLDFLRDQVLTIDFRAGRIHLA
jgi:hypothetical protein